MRRLTDEEIVYVFGKKGGNVSATCTALGISRTEFYRRKNKSEKLATLLKDTEEALLDFAESKLQQKISEGDTTCLIFFLKTKGRGRGYVEKIEQEVSVNPFLDLIKRASGK